MFLLCLKVFTICFVGTLGGLFALGFVNAWSRVSKTPEVRNEED